MIQDFDGQIIKPSLVKKFISSLGNKAKVERADWSYGGVVVKIRFPTGKRMKEIVSSLNIPAQVDVIKYNPPKKMNSKEQLMTVRNKILEIVNGRKIPKFSDIALADDVVNPRVIKKFGRDFVLLSFGAGSGLENRMFLKDMFNYYVVKDEKDAEKLVELIETENRVIRALEVASWSGQDFSSPTGSSADDVAFASAMAGVKNPSKKPSKKSRKKVAKKSEPEEDLFGLGEPVDSDQELDTDWLFGEGLLQLRKLVKASRK